MIIALRHTAAGSGSSLATKKWRMKEYLGMTKSLTEYIIICFLCFKIPSETSGFGPSKADRVGGGGVNRLSGFGTSTSDFTD